MDQNLVPDFVKKRGRIGQIVFGGAYLLGLGFFFTVIVPMLFAFLLLLGTLFAAAFVLLLATLVIFLLFTLKDVLRNARTLSLWLTNLFVGVFPLEVMQEAKIRFEKKLKVLTEKFKEVQTVFEMARQDVENLKTELERLIIEAKRINPDEQRVMAQRLGGQLAMKRESLKNREKQLETLTRVINAVKLAREICEMNVERLGMRIQQYRTDMAMAKATKQMVEAVEQILGPDASDEQRQEEATWQIVSRTAESLAAVDVMMMNLGSSAAEMQLNNLAAFDEVAKIHTAMKKEDDPTGVRVSNEATAPAAAVTLPFHLDEEELAQATNQKPGTGTGKTGS